MATVVGSSPAFTTNPWENNVTQSSYANQLMAQRLKGDRLVFYALAQSVHLSSIQKGIQTAHAIAEYEVMSRNNRHVRAMYDMWSKVDKTIIIKAGGDSQSLISHQADLHYVKIPSVIFFEDESLAKAATAVGCIVPYSMIVGSEDSLKSQHLLSLKQLPLAI